MKRLSLILSLFSLLLFGCEKNYLNEKKTAEIYVNLVFFYVENGADSIAFFKKRDSLLASYSTNLQTYESSLLQIFKDKNKTEVFFSWIDTLTERKKSQYLNR